jgi:hypothetical protein
MNFTLLFYSFDFLRSDEKKKFPQKTKILGRKNIAVIQITQPITNLRYEMLTFQYN